MSIIVQNSRMAHHRVSTTGLTPTIPTSEDFTDGSWLSTDLALGEIMFNMTDGFAWFRSDTGIIQFTTDANALFERQGDDIISVDTNISTPATLILNDNTNSNTGLASIVSGDTNSNTGDYSILTGFSNINNASHVIIGGDNNEANYVNTIISGKNNISNEDAQLIIGKGNTNIYSGSIMGGSVGTYGCYGTVAMGIQTTNATITELFCDTTGSKRFTLPTDTAFYVRLSAIAANTANGDSKEFHGEGVIKNVGGTTSLVAAITMTSTVGDAGLAAITMTVTADAGNNSLKVEATGIAATTINWVTSIDFTKIIH